MWKLAVVLISLLIVSAPAEARNIGELRQECLKAIVATDERDFKLDDAMSIGFCFGYMNGVSDTLVLLELTQRAKICLPERRTNVQLARVFVAWADKHPESHHKHPSIGVLEAMVEAFPCKD